METLDAIQTRRNIKKFEKTPVPEEVLKQVLSAAMNAASAGNEQPWHFIVITDHDILSKISKINPYAEIVKWAPAAILVCADLYLEKFSGNWVLDCAAASQNLLLASHDLGLGAVWTGIYPDEKRMKGFRWLLDLPDNIAPHSLIPIGYPAKISVSQLKDSKEKYSTERIHFNRW